MNVRNQESDAGGSERTEASGNYYSGSETFFGVFTQAQVYLSGVRLVHDGKVTQQVSDLASQIENNRRRFLHSGDVNFALQELTRITNAYNQRVQNWESEASRRERNKKTMSGGALAKMKAELSMVRTKIRLAGRTLTKLEVELHQIAGRELSESNRQQESGGNRNGNSGRSEVVAEAMPNVEQQPTMTQEEQAKAAECVRAVDRFLKQSVGKSLTVAFDEANLRVADKPDQIEQAWDAAADAGIPIFLAAGWTVKHPNILDGANRERKKLDLCFWLIPKSLNASQSLALIDGQIQLWISSRKLDSARITFNLASKSEFPQSDLLSGFLERFADRFGEPSPCLLVAHFQNLEWTQKSVIAFCSEKQDGDG
jgi:hypothetical protein